MKIRMTLEVPESARLHMGALGADGIDNRALATREAVRDFLQQYVVALAEDTGVASIGPLTDAEINDAREAVTYLRASGKSDKEIRTWLLMQQARIQVAARNIASDREFQLQEEIA